MEYNQSVVFQAKFQIQLSNLLNYLVALSKSLLSKYYFYVKIPFCSGKIKLKEF